jgi:hypothetical protein
MRDDCLSAPAMGSAAEGSPVNSSREPCGSVREHSEETSLDCVLSAAFHFSPRSVSYP